eukprot:g4806.t1
MYENDDDDGNDDDGDRSSSTFQKLKLAKTTRKGRRKSLDKNGKGNNNTPSKDVNELLFQSGWVRCAFGSKKYWYNPKNQVSVWKHPHCNPPPPKMNKVRVLDKITGHWYYHDPLCHTSQWTPHVNSALNSRIQLRRFTNLMSGRRQVARHKLKHANRVQGYICYFDEEAEAEGTASGKDCLYWVDIDNSSIHLKKPKPKESQKLKRAAKSSWLHLRESELEIAAADQTGVIMSAYGNVRPHDDKTHTWMNVGNNMFYNVKRTFDSQKEILGIVEKLQKGKKGGTDNGAVEGGTEKDKEKVREEDISKLSAHERMMRKKAARAAKEKAKRDASLAKAKALEAKRQAEREAHSEMQRGKSGIAKRMKKIEEGGLKGKDLDANDALAVALLKRREAFEESESEDSEFSDSDF